MTHLAAALGGAVAAYVLGIRVNFGTLAGLVLLAIICLLVARKLDRRG